MFIMLSQSIALLLSLGVVLADITGTNPAAGTCLCFDGTSVNVRSTPCGTVIGTGSTGMCHSARGQKQTCTLSGVSYEFFAIDFCGNQVGWAAGEYFNTGAASTCRPTVTGGTCASVDTVLRAEWGARAPSGSIPTISLPVAQLFIHHTVTPSGTTQDACSAQMRSIQNYHMDSNGWTDIGYNWLICEDGRAYEGRGWNKQGAHTSGHNSNAVAISVIGDFTSRLPNNAALNAIRHLLNCARNQNVITSGYDLFGHRDAPSASTACPGNTLYAEIQKWPEYSCGSPVL